MNRSYFLTLFFVLLSVCTQTGLFYKRLIIHNKTGKSVVIRVLSGIEEGGGKYGMDRPLFKEYTVLQDGIVTGAYDQRGVRVGDKKVTVQDNVFEYDLTEDATEGYVLNPTKK